MSRTLSTAALRAIFAQETDACFLTLLTITYPTLAAPLRICSGGKDLVREEDSELVTYLFFPFEISLPTDEDEGVPQVTLTIDNIDRVIVEAVREADEPPELALEVVLAESPDVTEYGPIHLTLREADYDRMAVRGTLMHERVLDEQFPAGTFDPARFPGLFANASNTEL